MMLRLNKLINNTYPISSLLLFIVNFDFLFRLAEPIMSVEIIAEEDVVTSVLQVNIYIVYTSYLF